MAKRKKKSSSTRKKTAAASRQACAVKMYLNEGKTQAEIGADIGVSAQTVSVYLAKARAEWAKRAAGELTAYRAEHLARLEALAARAFTAAIACKDEHAQAKHLELVRKTYSDIADLLGLDEASGSEDLTINANTLRTLLGLDAK